MKALIELLKLIRDNWSGIVIVAGLVVAILQKAKAYSKLTNDERVEMIKSILKETMIKFVSEAEFEWELYSESGKIKRGQVIQKIYDKYPILSQVLDQTALIAEIDAMIDAALVELRKSLDATNAKLIVKNKDTETK